MIDINSIYDFKIKLRITFTLRKQAANWKIQNGTIFLIYSNDLVVLCNVKYDFFTVWHRHTDRVTAMRK